MTAQYSGDVNIEYGGTFFDLSNWQYGYVSAVRVTDLDSAIGFRGAVHVEKIVINGVDDPERVANALRSCGWTSDDVSPDTDEGKHQIADALMCYGYYDPDDNHFEPSSITIQCEEDGPMEHDGWKADYRLPDGEDLREHIESKYVDLA